MPEKHENHFPNLFSLQACSIFGNWGIRLGSRKVHITNIRWAPIIGEVMKKREEVNRSVPACGNAGATLQQKI